MPWIMMTTGHSPREAEIVQLLQDWADEFPPAGPGLGEMIMGASDISYGEDWPLNAEALRRMNKRGMIGESYAYLDNALSDLEDSYPKLFRAINAAYLDPDVSHSEVAHWRTKARQGSTRLGRMVDLHDRAIRWLAYRLKDADLWVRWPDKTSLAFVRDMVERHEELVRVYQSFLEEGRTQAISIKHAAIKCDYSLQHARRVIKERTGER